MRQGLMELLESAQQYWQDLPSATREMLTVVGVILGTALVASILGRLVRGRLARTGMDSGLRPPWLPPLERKQVEEGITPSRVMGFLAGLTIWGVVACVVCWRFPGWVTIGNGIFQGMGMLWLLVGVVLVALWLGRLMAALAIRLVRATPVHEHLENWLKVQSSDHDTRPGVGLRAELIEANRSVSLSSAIIACPIYAIVLLLTLLIAADLFGWGSVGGVLSAVWRAGLRVAMAAVALLIAWLGCRWATTLEAGSNETQRTQWYLQTAIIGGGALLAMLLLSGEPGSLLALLAFAVLLVLLWPLRFTVPDLVAGIYLRACETKKVKLKEGEADLVRLGLLVSALSRDDQTFTLRNRVIWAAVTATTEDHSKESDNSVPSEEFTLPR